jgi:hypothetical protein
MPTAGARGRADYIERRMALGTRRGGGWRCTAARWSVRRRFWAWRAGPGSETFAAGAGRSEGISCWAVAARALRAL